VRYEKKQKQIYEQSWTSKIFKKENPELKIIISGCIAQLQSEHLLNKAPYINYIIGPDNLHILANIAENELPQKVFTHENTDMANIELPVVRKAPVKAWVNIIYGCNNYCAYCIVPYTRGRERSRPMERVIEEVKALTEQGYKEITLLGQNVNSYKDKDVDFPALLEEVNKIEGIERIRFVTSHPKDLSQQLIKTMKDCNKVCEHIHSATSGKVTK